MRLHVGFEIGTRPSAFSRKGNSDVADAYPLAKSSALSLAGGAFWILTFLRGFPQSPADSDNTTPG